MRQAFARIRLFRASLRVLIFLWLSISTSFATTDYTVSLANPEQHLVQVKILLPAGPAERELQMPVWNALYQIRDFAQYVNWIRAQDRAGRSLTVHSVSDSRWQITGAEDGAIVEYQIFVGFPRSLRSAVQSASCIFQSRPNSYVSRRCPKRFYDRAL